MTLLYPAIRDAFEDLGLADIMGGRDFSNVNRHRAQSIILAFLRLKRSGKNHLNNNNYWIPNEIIAYWDKDEIPEDVKKCLDSWNATGINVNIFNFNSARQYICDNCEKDVVEAFDYAHHPAMQSDIFRLAYLKNEGGMYIDADDEYVGLAGRADLATKVGLTCSALARSTSMSRNVDVKNSLSNLDSDIFFYANNTPLISIPNHPVISCALARSVKNVINRKKKSELSDINNDTGPVNMTISVAKYLLECASSEINPDIDIVESNEFIDSFKDLLYKKTNLNWRTNSMIYKPSQKTSSSEMEGVFASKYAKDSDWGGHSGPGSSSIHLGEYRSFVERFINFNNIKEVVEVGCGDWQFSKFVDFGAASYVGYDVVSAIVDINNSKYKNDKILFKVMPEFFDDVQGGDLLIVKDVLQHLPDEYIKEFIETLIPKFKFSLITNSYVKLNTKRNIDIAAGGFRALDLTAEPYNVKGCYVLEASSAVWERLRTLLIAP